MPIRSSCGSVSILSDPKITPNAASGPPASWNLALACSSRSFQVALPCLHQGIIVDRPHHPCRFCCTLFTHQGTTAALCPRRPVPQPQIRKFLMASPHPAGVKSCHRLLQQERTPQRRRRSPVLVRWPDAGEHDFQLARWAAEWGVGWILSLLVAIGHGPARYHEALTLVRRVTGRAPLEKPCGLGVLSKWRPPPPSAACSLLSRPLPHSS